MSRLLISLVSDQTIPNILAACYFKPDRLLFITTAFMEKKQKTDHIIQTLKLKNLNPPYEKITVQQDSFTDCTQKIKNWLQKNKAQYNEIIVNITGGTKIMSLASYETFRTIPNTQIIYIPIPKNEFFTLPQNTLTPIDIRLGVREYLMAYGVTITDKEMKRAQTRGEIARQRFKKTEFIYQNYSQLKPLLKLICSELRQLEQKNSKLFQNPKKEISHTFSYKSKFNLTNIMKQLLTDWNFQFNNQEISLTLTPTSYHYFIGGWLEEYIYNLLYELKEDGITDVQLNLHIFSPQKTQNEFDVFFTYENALYFIECKSLDQEHDKDQDILYKVGALKNTFGLNVKSFLATQSPNIFDKNGQIKDSLQKRAKQMQTTILPLTQITDLKQILRQKIIQKH